MQLNELLQYNAIGSLTAVGVMETYVCMCGVSVGAGEPTSLLGADDLYEGGREDQRGHKQKQQYMQTCESEGGGGVRALRAEPCES